MNGHERAAERQAAERAWAAIRAELEARKEHIVEAIRAYPAPIPACDLQFNTLLAERDQVAAELERLDAVRGESAARGATRAAVEAFLLASGCIDAEAGRRLRAGLEA